MTNDAPYDIAIIGGGVNGCGIARDAAGRGLRVLLVEKDDLASGTSSASTKLVHGGLRYLEYYEFGLVRESLSEREVLWRMAPHIIRPLRFVLPHHSGLRPALLIRLGLFLYDHLGGRQLLPPSRTIDLTRDPAGRPLKAQFTRGFEYSDCWVDDARLVVLNAIDAAKRGASVHARTEMIHAARVDGQWQIGLADRVSGEQHQVSARILINAAGPWVAQVANLANSAKPTSVRLVKGSHIVVPRLFDHDRAYIFQNADRRIVFAIPYEHEWTLIGTTDVDFNGDLAKINIEDNEVEYLCDAASSYFARAIRPEEVVWNYSGVRPLVNEGDIPAHAVTRDYVLELNGSATEPVLLNIFGGKITTYRRLAEDALAKLAPWLEGKRTPWTRNERLPGGDLPVDGIDALAREVERMCPELGTATAARVARAYGTSARQIFANVRSAADLGCDFGAGLYEREVCHLVANEWAVTAEDIVWRRSKLGLRMTDHEVQVLDEWLATNHRLPQSGKSSGLARGNIRSETAHRDSRAI
jgi:glycerol-3-phosphate dehydrogenase